MRVLLTEGLATHSPLIPLAVQRLLTQDDVGYRFLDGSDYWDREFWEDDAVWEWVPDP